MLSAILVIFLYVTSLSDGRGPHHPRGSKIVKYHSHYRPIREAEVKLTQDEELLHDTEHLQEHLENVINEPDLSKMSEEELEFYYFQVHDTDKNSKLDGLEILQAIYHTSHDDDNNNEDQNDDNNQFNYYVELIDKVLKEDDTDNDGYLSYPEYVEGRKKDVNKGSTVKIKPLDSQPSVKEMPVPGEQKGQG